MTALHRLRFERDHAACAGVEHGRGAGIKRGIDGEDEHDANVEVFQLGLNALLRYFRVYIHREAAPRCSTFGQRYLWRYLKKGSRPISMHVHYHATSAML